MLNWFHTLPDIMIELIILVFMLGITTVLPYIIRRRFNLTPDDGLAKGAEESFKVLISVTILLLAFCLVRLQGDHRTTEDLVSRQAMVMLKLDRAFGAFGGTEGARLHSFLEQYAQSVLDDEWPLLIQNGRSDKTDQHLVTLAQASRELEAKGAAQQLSRTEVLKGIEQLSDLHEALLSTGRLALPELYWYAIVTSLIFFTGLAWFQSPLNKLLLYVGGVTCGISLLFALFVAHVSLFQGESRVMATQIEKAIVHIKKTKVDG